MDSQAIETLRRVGTPGPVIDGLQALEARRGQIRSERFQSSREAEEINKAEAEAAEAINAHLARDLADADAERDKELQRLQAELEEQTRIPSRLMGETSDEHTAKLLRRQIQESRRLSSLMLAVADCAAISMMTDPGLIVATVDEALAGAEPEAISRIGRAAEAKLGAMAAEESNRQELGRGFEAHVLVQTKMRDWRAATAGQSIEARRERIVARHTQRTLDVRNRVMSAARLFGVDVLVARSAALSALQEQ